MWLVDDGSTDDSTFERCAFHAAHDERITAVRIMENRGAAFARHQAISMLGNGDAVIALLDMDDELLPGALERVAREYEAGKWMTYGNWTNQNGDGLPPGFRLEYSAEVHAARAYRADVWRCTHLRTFKKWLFDEIPAEDQMMDGEWIKTATEAETMFSILEMCGPERIGVVHEPIYKYNQNLPGNSQRRFGQQYKNHVFRRICERPAKQLIHEGGQHLR